MPAPRGQPSARRRAIWLWKLTSVFRFGTITLCGGGSSDSFGVEAASVPTDDLDAAMLSQPLSNGLGRPIRRRQHVDDLAFLKVIMMVPQCDDCTSHPGHWAVSILKPAMAQRPSRHSASKTRNPAAAAHSWLHSWDTRATNILRVNLPP